MYQFVNRSPGTSAWRVNADGAAALPNGQQV